MFTVDEVYTSIKIADIEASVSEFQIFRAYCPSFIELDKDFKSEFYEDNKPDCRIYVNSSNRLSYHDFGNNDHMNCYTYVMKKYSCNFSECLRIIANDFNIKNSRRDLGMKPNFMFGRETVEQKQYVAKDKPTIEIVSRNWNLTDYNYWFKQYEISFEWLTSYDVIPCSYVYLKRGENTTVFASSKTNPIYAYRFKHEGVISYKIYFPLSSNPKHKWLFSGGVHKNIEGFDQLPDKDNILIITKSLKDVMACRLCGYSAISLQGEGNKFSQELYDKLIDRFDEFIVFYDDDQGGRDGANDITSKYGFKSIVVPSEYESKDLSDLIAKIGLNSSKIVLNKLIEMTQLKKGVELNKHVKMLCEQIKEKQIDFKKCAKPKHPVDELGYPLNDSIGG